MIINLFLTIILGVVIGTFTGLVPGIHINLLGAVFLYFLERVNFVSNKFYLLIFICSLSIAHTFSDFIPSVFLGCPNTENSLLPGHELLKEGKGLQAVFLSSYGSLLGIVLIIIFSPAIIKLALAINEKTNFIMAYILILISIIIFIKEKNKIPSIKIIILSSLAGLVILNSNFSEPLLPMFSGLFGIPLIIESIKNKTKIKEQENRIHLPKKKLKPLIFAGLSSMICGFLPGLGTSQSAVLSTSFYKTSREEFLMLIGAANTIVLIMSFLTLYSVGKTRTGVAVLIKEVSINFSYKIIILILISVLISGIFSFFITLFISRKICNRIDKYNYQSISLIVLITIIAINFIVGRVTNILILIPCALIGLYSNKLNARKSNMMYCLLTPTIWFYLTNN